MSPAVMRAIAAATERRDVPEHLMEDAMEAILAGDSTPAQIAGLAIALRMKGETAGEIAAAARVMRRRCHGVEVGGTAPVLDTCGTGGDGAGTFNVSTVAAIVVAACGVRVAKHGNRAVSSRCGSADVLEALGVVIEQSPARVADSIDRLGIGFCFAPAHHGALKHAAPVRRELGVRTFFNLLGPLANPAFATHQLLGIYDPARLEQFAEVLDKLGVVSAWVVHGEGGLDEISPEGVTDVAVLAGGRVTRRQIEPEEFGLARFPATAIGGGDAKRNAELARQVLAGERIPHRDAVLLNAAAALMVSGIARDALSGARRAAEAIDSGAATETLEKWIAFTRGRG